MVVATVDPVDEQFVKLLEDMDTLVVPVNEKSVGAQFSSG